ncbi:MAG: O-antigen ligase family protein [Flavobacteriales bacterium]|nr:O-antigen ligase family protein [Flavobacteriales bacterium]
MVAWRVAATASLQKAIPPLFLAIAIALPYSIRLYFSALDLEVIFPAEPLIGLLLLVIAARILLGRARFEWDRDALRHPLVLVAFLWIAALGFSALGSEHAMVSMKALLVRCAFIVLFFLLPVLFPAIIHIKRRSVLLAHALSFFGVVAYAFHQQSLAGFDRHGASLAPFPFYVDHTSYSAVLVYVLVLLAVESIIAVRERGAPFPWDLMLLLGLGAVAFYLAFCRAAWISVAALLIALLLLRLRIVFKWFTLVASTSALFIVCALAYIAMGHGPVVADSNAAGAGARASVLSVTNVSTDASNKERVNRWKCAMRMFRDRPLLGHGVGTFQFTFLPYQLKEEMTYISVTGSVDPKRVQRVWSFSEELFVRRNPQLLYCSGGTAHSEYLLALSESGLIAFLVFTALAWATLSSAFHGSVRNLPPNGRIRHIGAWLASLAYLVHALFNNYLDDPKVAMLFWITLGGLVAPRSQVDVKGAGQGSSSSA